MLDQHNIVIFKAKTNNLSEIIFERCRCAWIMTRSTRVKKAELLREESQKKEQKKQLTVSRDLDSKWNVH